MQHEASSSLRSKVLQLVSFSPLGGSRMAEKPSSSSSNSGSRFVIEEDDDDDDDGVFNVGNDEVPMPIAGGTGEEDRDGSEEQSAALKSCKRIVKTFSAYVPLIYVFLSGIGFSIQSLFVKLLRTETGFSGSFEFIFMRGFIQLIIASLFVHFETLPYQKPRLFGNTKKVTILMVTRSIVGYGGIAFSFLAVERMPIGDSTVLVMLSPLFASAGAAIFLGESWRIQEFSAMVVSLVGATLVARPAFVFGGVSADALGVTYALLGSFTAGMAYVLVRVLGTTALMPWSNVCVVQALGQILLSVPSSFLWNQSFKFDLSTKQFCLIFFGGSLGAWSQILMTIGMQREKSASATGMRMSDVVFGFVWQILFTSDEVTKMSVVGAVLVSLSVLMIVLFKQVDPAKPPPMTTGVRPTRVVSLSTINPMIMDNVMTEPEVSLSSSDVDDIEQNSGSNEYKSVSQAELINL